MLPLTDRCLLALFTGDSSTMAVTCPTVSGHRVDDIIPIDDSTAVFLSAQPDIIANACEDGASFRESVAQGATRIDLSPGCSASSRAGIFHLAEHLPETRAIQVEAIDWETAMLHLPDPESIAGLPPGSVVPPLLQLNMSDTVDKVAPRRSNSRTPPTPRCSTGWPGRRRPLRALHYPSGSTGLDCQREAMM